MLQNQKGFTLIELAIVIAILGIIAVVAIPAYINMTTTATIGTLEGACGSLKGSVGIYIARNRGAVPTVNQLLTTTYLTKDPRVIFYSLSASDTAVISVDGGTNSYGSATVGGTNKYASITDGTDTWTGCNLSGLVNAASTTAVTF